MCKRALLEVKAEYAAKGKTIKQLVFNREPGIVPSQDILNDNGIELILKAAGQKVGLAEVSIRLIREKARATKAGVRSKFGYLPPNQFNVDLCLDSISVLNRIPKHDQTMTPFELMGGKCMDQLRDLRAEFDKFKVQVLARGDKQIYSGESEGPVARVESLLMLLGIAIHEDLTIFKVDVGSAFMRTPMADDIQHKWVQLNKMVVQVLRELQPKKYDDYVLPDGTVIVTMKNLSYGYVEAAHYWWRDLTGTLRTVGMRYQRRTSVYSLKG